MLTAGACPVGCSKCCQHRTHLVQVQSQSCQAVHKCKLVLRSFMLLHPSTILYDSEMTMSNHISKVVNICFFQLRSLWQVWHLVGRKVTTQLVSTFVFSWLDYCNSLLGSLPQSIIKPLQCALKSAAWCVAGLGLFAHVTLAFNQLHWLPIKDHIRYKLCLQTRQQKEVYGQANRHWKVNAFASS